MQPGIDIGLRQSSNPLNIDSKSFDCDAYLSKILKEKGINQLIVAERDVTKEIHRLDSDMQTLVYENYNKFIAATDTIRKMKMDFGRMEEEVKKLVQNMDKIDCLSKDVSDGLSHRRNDVKKLAKISSTLKHLEFIFKLPDNLQNLIQQRQFTSAIDAFNKAKDFTSKYEKVPAFTNTMKECHTIMFDLKGLLKDSFKGNLVTSKELSVNVAHLVHLGESPETLGQEYLQSIFERLRSEADLIKAASEINTSSPCLPSDVVSDLSLATSSNDILEFIDVECSNFLSNLSLMVASCAELFPNVLLDVEDRIHTLMDLFLPCVENRFHIELESTNCSFYGTPSLSSSNGVAGVTSISFNATSSSSFDGVRLTRALDRFYRRIQSACRLMPVTSSSGMTKHIYERQSYKIIFNTCCRHCELTATMMQQRFEILLLEVRQRLALMKNVTLPVSFSTEKNTESGVDIDKSNIDNPESKSLPDLLIKLEKSMIHDVKSSLASMLQMTTQDLSYINQNPKFIGKFGLKVRQQLIFGLFEFIIDYFRRLTEHHPGARGIAVQSEVGTSLIILLAKFCQNLSQSTAGYLLDLCEQQFRISKSSDHHHSSASKDKNDESKSRIDSAKSLDLALREEAQRLIDQFVIREGFAISQMLVKSVETRDWLGCTEPKSVRAVMKRVVEDFTTMDWRLSQFFEDGRRSNRSSDSSRRTAATYGYGYSKYASNKVLGQKHHWSPADSTLSTTLGKLWSERVDYFSSVQFEKFSIITGVTKICLKTLLESVRSKTFGKFGLQQMQVDAHYLQLYLWRFLNDESLADNLLDEIVCSVANRCVDPQLMEPGVIELICNRN